MESLNKETEEVIEMMSYVIRDEDTDEIVGVREDAPAYVIERFKKYMEELDSIEPVER